MEINCIVIDDEPLAVLKLEDFIARVPGMRLLGSFYNALEAMNWLRENKIDLIFLDIQMEQLSGIEFLEVTGLNTEIIVTSAYDQYAIKGYEFNITDYLLKPFSFQRFLKAVNKASEHLALKADQKKDPNEGRQTIFVKTEYRLEKIDTVDILYVEGMKDYLMIVCHAKKIMTLQTFAKLEESLPPDKFCRVHKSFIVSIDKIESIERGTVIISKRRIPVSSTYRDILFKKIGLQLPKQ
jgi:two-component system, LytTR family, response regulator